MIGNALWHKLKKQKDNILINHNINLLSQLEVNEFFKNNIIDQVYITSAKSGGIFANNSYPANFIYENLITEANIIHACFSYNVKKILFISFDRETVQFNPMV